MEEFEYEVTGIEYTSDDEPFEPENPLNRPAITYKKCVIAFVGFLLLLTGVYLGVGLCVRHGKIEQGSLITGIATLVAGVGYLSLVAKRGVIWCVKVYQHYAPDHVRLRCAFEPSCSEYMILAVEKYGTVKGVAKGIRRLLRCHPPGGVDYP